MIIYPEGKIFLLTIAIAIIGYLVAILIDKKFGWRKATYLLLTIGLISLIGVYKSGEAHRSYNNQVKQEYHQKQLANKVAQK